MKAKRLYKMKDGESLKRGMNNLFFFKQHQAYFTAFNPVFDAAFLANWESALDNLTKYYDMDRIELIAEKSLLTDVGEVMQRCYNKYTDVKYFAGKAFPANAEVMREFGEGEYSKLRNSHLRMEQFMERLWGVATKYKTELIAANYTQAAIDEIATLAGELRTANQQQQLKKKERPVETRKRIEALNAFYAFAQEASEAAKIIYRDNRVLREEFRLGVRHHPKASKGWFTVGAGRTHRTQLVPLLKKNSLQLSNQGKDTVEYWQADKLPEIPAEKHLLAAGETVTVAAQQPAKKFLTVYNPSGKAVRMMLRKEKKK